MNADTAQLLIGCALGPVGYLLGVLCAIAVRAACDQHRGPR